MPKVQTKAMLGCGFPLFATAICVMCFLSIVASFRKNEKGKTRLRFGGRKLERWRKKPRWFLQKKFFNFPFNFFLQK